jgi:hypothetical protein
MLEIRITHRMYRITNATLDQLLGAEFWRGMSTPRLVDVLKAQHAAGKLVIDGQRLRCASPGEEAAQRLRTSESLEEILRNGLLHIAAQIGELASDVRSLREHVELDTEAADAPLARGRSEAPQFQTNDAELSRRDGDGSAM